MGGVGAREGEPAARCDHAVAGLGTQPVAAKAGDAAGADRGGEADDDPDRGGEGEQDGGALARGRGAAGCGAAGRVSGGEVGGGAGAAGASWTASWTGVSVSSSRTAPPAGVDGFSELAGGAAGSGAGGAGGGELAPASGRRLTLISSAPGSGATTCPSARERRRARDCSRRRSRSSAVRWCSASGLRRRAAGVWGRGAASVSVVSCSVAMARTAHGCAAVVPSPRAGSVLCREGGRFYS